VEKIAQLEYVTTYRDHGGVERGLLAVRVRSGE
jgi:hypothetical protein